MSEIWYRVCSGSTVIERTEWDKSTAHFLVKGTRKDAKAQTWYNYFQNWEQARESIRKRIEVEISSHQANLRRLHRQRDEVEAMQEPSQ